MAMEGFAQFSSGLKNGLEVKINIIVMFNRLKNSGLVQDLLESFMSSIFPLLNLHSR